MSKKTSVYIVDDDTALRDSLVLLLEAHGLNVTQFSSAAEFLARVPALNSGCALIDIHMPGMSGIELLEKLALNGSKFPCVMMTGLGDVPLAVKAMQAGAVDFIEKPFEPETLLDALDRANRRPRHIPHSEGVSQEVSALLNQLTPREMDVLRHLTLGQANKIIAHELGISPRTVEVHRARLMSKLNAHSVADVVRLGLAAGVAP
jgi:two-component system, LuxR family, response regulator FixJ